MSAGRAAFLPGDDATAWIERADTALYQPRQPGPDRVMVV